MTRSAADNCGACGKEFPTWELTPIKLGSTSISNIKICKSCLDNSDAHADLRDAAEIMRLMNYLDDDE